MGKVKRKGQWRKWERSYQAYHEAGADVIFVEAPRNKEEMRRITQTIRAPHLANMADGGGKTPILPAQDLRDLGFKIAIYPSTVWMASIKAMQEVLQRCPSS